MERTRQVADLGTSSYDAADDPMLASLASLTPPTISSSVARNIRPPSPLELRKMATHFGIAFAELVPFTWMLLWWLGTPIAWVMQLVRLLLFVFVLLPFFLPQPW